MITKARRKTGWIAGACVAAAVALGGCGADGTSRAAISAAQKPSVTGTVYAPNGQFAARARSWQWAHALTLVARADALQGMAGVTTPEEVSLSRLDPGVAAHGCPPQVGCAQLLASAYTDSSGHYAISDDALANLDTGRLIVHVGSDSLLTRAFVFSRTADIDATGEALVRLVLQRLTQTPPVPLDAFTADALQTLAMWAKILTQDLPGTAAVSLSAGRTDCDGVSLGVACLNDIVFERLASSATMQNTMNDIVGHWMAQHGS